jgi:PAS domain S-box-containing protein
VTALAGAVYFAWVGMERQRAIEAAQVRAQAMADLALQNTYRMFESADVALGAVSMLVGPKPDWDAIAKDGTIWYHLRDLADALSTVPRLLLIDDQGMIRVFSDRFGVEPASVKDRDYFLFHRANLTQVPRVGRPILGRVSNQLSIPLSRRLFFDGGGFAGVALANVDPNAFMENFQSLGMDSGGFFNLQLADGTILARYPQAEGAVGRRVDNDPLMPAFAEGKDSGVAIYASPVDGVVRVNAFRRLDRFGLVMWAGLPLDQVLATWMGETIRMGVALLLGLLVLGALFLVAMRHYLAEKAIQARLRESEATLLQAQAVAELGYYVFDIAADRWDSSQVLDGIFGIDAAYGRKAADWLALVAPVERPAMAEYLAGILEGRYDFDREYRIIRPSDGELRWVWGIGQVERDDQGRPTRMVGTIKDVTKRRLAEEALRLKAEELERSNIELEQFAYVASHDLREPLRMVGSYVELLARRYADKLDADAMEFIAFARDGAKRMDRLILDLLEYSRIGRITRPMVMVGLDKVLDRCLKALAAKIEEADATIVLPDAPLPAVLGDADELGRLFQNLIGNAVKYRAPDRKAEIRLSAERDGLMWRITVADNGIGIEPQFFDRVFLIFQRLHKRGDYEGTGIGLSICKKIAEHHNGRIWVESEVGQGSRFFVTLPAMD